VLEIILILVAVSLLMVGGTVLFIIKYYWGPAGKPGGRAGARGRRRGRS
jgi:hypothetical protein